MLRETEKPPMAAIDAAIGGAYDNNKAVPSEIQLSLNFFNASRPCNFNVFHPIPAK